MLAQASPLRSGDQLAGLAAETQTRRVAAQWALADLPLTAFLSDTVIPYEADEVTRLILDTHDAAAFAPVRHLTVGGLRDDGWPLLDGPARWRLGEVTVAWSAVEPGGGPLVARS
mgnify:CR=1 FL=1